MKKRIGTLKGHPIVDGDINLVRYPEIHQKTLGAGEWENGEPIKITLKKFSDSEGYFYYAFVIFPVDVSIPEGIGVILPITANNSVSGLPEQANGIILNFHEKIIPANIGVLVVDQMGKKECSFRPFTEKINYGYPFNGIGVYQDSYTQDIWPIFDGSGIWAATADLNDDTSIKFTPLEEGSLVPKYTPLWIYKKLPLENKIKLNHIFKKK